ncbi:MAG: ABC transporter ATP-binding protein [Beijerinckiaceae bacterium]
MATLDVRDITKAFGPTQVLKGVSLSVESGEFFTLLGPSGCGKTTLLRMIAGFLKQDTGAIHVDGEHLDPVPAHRRDIGMVFQDYAIFPHLRVRDNVAFGLKTRGMPAAERDARVEESLKMVRLDGLGARFPSEMSGGQQQRVGLARAMAIRPRLLLMDEPLSNLDAKLRIELREDIRDLQRRLGITTIYVTHDQEEALAISDRICVMHAGRIEQVATPFDIYRDPARRFAASFVGTMNFIAGDARDGRILVGGQDTGLRTSSIGPVELAVRPENIMVGACAAPAVALQGHIRKATFLGREAHLTVATDAGELIAQLTDPARELAAQDGKPVTLHLPRDRIFLYGSDGARITTGSTADA